jgi:AraC family transcriptional regulator
VHGARTCTVRSSRGVQLSVTRLRSDLANHGAIAPLPREDSYLVVLCLRDVSVHRLWLDGREMPLCRRSSGDVCIADLERDPSAYLESPFDWLQFKFPRSALDEAADDLGSSRIGRLGSSAGACTSDPIVNHLGMCLLPALEHPPQLNKLFVEYVASALCVHLASTYGQLRIPSQKQRGSLAAWQERRAMELMMSRLDGEISLAQIASECSLSVGHFGRAFRQSTGLPPHRWLSEQRISKAKDLLTNSGLPILEIALMCGFAEQSHFTRVFKRSVGESPGVWRRDRMKR